MIKVVIIDDESIIRIGLKAIIDWEANGFLIVGEAANGKDGLELIRNTQPDLVITDIKMPQMDGISLIREVNRSNPDIKFIIMSGHGEFELIRSAMKLGAIDYIMKLELDPESLLESLGAYKEKFAGKHTDAGLEIRQKKRELREREFVNYLLYETPTREKFLSFLEELGLALNERHFAVALLFSPENPSADDRWKMRDMYLRDIPAEILGENFTAALYGKEYGTYLLLLSDGAGPDRTADALADAYRRIRKKLKALLNSDVSLAVSRFFDGFDHIDEAVTECRHVLKSLLYQESPGLKTGPLPVCAEVLRDLPRQEHDLRRAMLVDDREEIAKIFQSIRQGVASPDTDMDTALEACRQFAYFLMAAPEENGGAATADPARQALSDSVGQLNTATEVRRWFDRLWDSLVTAAGDAAGTGSRNILRARQYLNAHIGEKVTLKDVSDYLHLSPNYLSSLFKKEMGKGFVEFFNEIKIRRAMELISAGNWRIYEVSSQLGFENSYYFSKVFKKFTGLTPTEYEEKTTARP